MSRRADPATCAPRPAGSSARSGWPSAAGRVAWLLPCLALAALAQTSTPVTREGPFFRQTTHHKAGLPAGTRLLRVQSSGAVTVRGAADNAVVYSLRKRVKLRNQKEAERLLEQFAVHFKIHGSSAHFTAELPARGSAMAELELQVPRSLPRLEIRTDAGAVDASHLAGVLSVETGGGLIRLDEIGGDVDVRSGGGEINLGKIGGSLRCLSGGGTIRAGSIGGAASLETGGGEIYIHQVKGPVEAATAGGNIHIEKAGASVNANTSGGLIDVLYADGPVTAGTGAGCIKVASARGVRLESAAGPIQLRGVSGPLNVSTLSGNIVTELLAGVALEDSFLNTGAGDVTVYIPSNFPVTVRARNESLGRVKAIVSDFPEIRVKPAGLTASSPLLAEGELNGGGPLLRILAAGGTIYLRKQR